VFSSRFSRALEMFAERFELFKAKDDVRQRGKDVFLLEIVRE